MVLNGIVGTSIVGAALLVATGYSPASAAPVSLTWDPQASSPSLSSNAPQFAFSSITVQDLATVYLTPNASGGFDGTEFGYLPATAFNGVAPSGLNGSGVSNPYGIYGQFSGTFSTNASGLGTFSSVTFKLVGDPGYTDQSGAGGFTFSPTTGAVHTADNSSPDAVQAGNVLLATGALTPGQNQATFINGLPTASVSTTFVQEPTQAGFFVSPPSTVNLDLFGSFTNSITQVKCFASAGFESACGILGANTMLPGVPGGVTVMLEIGGSGVPGGGSADFVAAPEPTSLFLLGSGLVGLSAFARRRRDRKV